MMDAAPAQAAAPAAQDPAYAAAVQLRQSGRAREAVAAFEQLTRERPGDADVWLNLGLAQAALGRYDAADRALRTALLLAPDYTDVRLAYARVALFRDDRDEARRRLAPLLDQPQVSPEARTLEGELAAPADPATLAWRLDASVTYARLSQALPPWRAASLALSRSFADRSTLSGFVEQTERFNVHDTYLEARALRRLRGWSVQLGLGGAPDADYRPELAVLGGLSAPPLALSGAWSLELAADASWQRYGVGDVRSIQPSASLHYGERATLVLRSINTWDERDVFRSGYAVRGALLVGPRLRLNAGWSDAPESSDGVTVDVKAANAGAALELDPATAVRLDLVREERRAYDRDELSVGLTRRF